MQSASSCRAYRTTSGRCSARCRRPRAIWRAKRSRSIGYAVILFYIDPRLALVCLTGAPILLYPLVRLGQRIRRTARRSQEAQEHMSHVAAETFAAHRIVKAFGAEEREAGRFRDALQRSVSHQHAGGARVVADASRNGAARRHRHGGGVVVRQQRDRDRAPDNRRFHDVPGGDVDDVRAGEETEPREREPAAGDCGRRTHLRDARYAHRGRGVAERRAIAAVRAGD